MLKNELYKFGYSVAIDSGFAVVGVPGYKSNQGAAMVYQFMDQKWQRVAILTAFDGGRDHYLGKAVDISGNTVVVSSLRNISGIVYVFEKPESGWKDMTHTAILLPENTSEVAEFGYTIDIEGETIVVTDHGEGEDIDPAVYVFEKPTTGWKFMTPIAKLEGNDVQPLNNFGFSVDYSDSTIVVGAPQTNNYHGKVYIFEKPANGWADSFQTGELTAFADNIAEQFGYAVAIEKQTIVVSTLYGKNEKDEPVGSVYVFERPDSGWSDTASWVQLRASDSKLGNRFGTSVDMTDSMIVVGMIDDWEYASAIYMYNRPDDGWKHMYESGKLVPSSIREENHYGSQMSMTDQGVIVGVPNDSTDGYRNGAVYFYNKPPSGWEGQLTENQKIIPDQSILSIRIGEISGKITIAPNPVQDFLHIGNTRGNIIKIEIWDMHGNIRLERTDISNGQIDIAHLTPDIYILQIQTDIGIVNKKIVKN